MFDRFRIRLALALWIAPELPSEVAIQKMTETRQAALEESAKICDELARESEVSGYQDGRMAAFACAARIRYRAEHSEMFADELRRRSA